MGHSPISEALLVWNISASAVLEVTYREYVIKCVAIQVYSWLLTVVSVLSLLDGKLVVAVKMKSRVI